MSDLVKIRVTYPSQNSDAEGFPVSEPEALASPHHSDMGRSGGLTRFAVAVIGVVVVGGAIGAGFLFSGASDPSSPAPVAADTSANPTADTSAEFARAEPQPEPEPEPEPLRTAVASDSVPRPDNEQAGKADDASVAQFETSSAPATETVETAPVRRAPPSETAANEAPPVAMMLPLPVKKPATKVSASELAATPDGSVARSQLTSAVRGREPVDRLSSRVKIGEGGSRKLFYFTELKGLNGETIFHRWEHDGRTVVALRFNVGSDRWRAYSSKMIPAHQAGDWRVLVANAEGDVLASSQFVAE